jgi:cell division protein FtsI (penicillin-binding protein 3)
VIREMLENVVSNDGTAPQAAIPGYRVAGKTGTAKMANPDGGYSDDRYRALFAGMVPASDPRLVMVVVIDEPSAGKFYGGDVAAPVFAAVMDDALRLLNIPPDGLPESPAQLAQVEAE